MNYYINGILVSELVIPEGVTSINRHFATYGNFKSVYVPDSVSIIKYASFYNATIGELLGCKNVSAVDENSEYPAFYNSNVDNIDKDVPFSIVQYDWFRILSRRYKNTSYTYSFDNNVMALMLGNVEFITRNGAYFSDMTTSKTITLTQTGGIQNLTERLKIGYITLSIKSNKSDAQFRVDYTDINSGEAASAIVGVGSTPLPMKPITSITVTAITEYEGLVPSGAKTISSASASNSVTIDYVEKTDIYIQHIDGTLYTTDEWTAGGYANDQANGVAVICASTSFVIAKGDISSSSLVWGGYNKTITDIVTTSSSSTAVLDFDGENNTTKIIEQLSGYTDSYSVTGAPAAEACVAYVFPNGKTGYLGALGQSIVVSNNKTAVNSAMSLIGGTAFTNKYYWTSTQRSNTYSWCHYLQSGTINYSNKSSSYPVRAFCSLT